MGVQRMFACCCGFNVGTRFKFHRTSASPPPGTFFATLRADRNEDRFFGYRWSSELQTHDQSTQISLCCGAAPRKAVVRGLGEYAVSDRPDLDLALRSGRSLQ